MAFQFELDDMSEGEGHWRMFLRDNSGMVENNNSFFDKLNFFKNDEKTEDVTMSETSSYSSEKSELKEFEWSDREKCVFLMGYKSSENEISLCARTILPSQIGKDYRIEITLPGENPIIFTAPREMSMILWVLKINLDMF
jgi:hypothetical protein